ncbi:MAG: ribosome silencing factor [Clostridia bacterium]|nr:ribosome silencing factor [Clostridia bacterium]
METKQKLDIIEKALDDKKASQIEILDVKEQTSLADYFIIASCQSTVQVRACADEVEEKMQESGEDVRHTEGYRNGSWILMDYGDVIVHVMQQEMREFYAIERLWDDVSAENLTTKE